MRLVLYLALLYTCYFLAIGVDSVAGKRQKCYYVDKFNNKLRLVSHQRRSEKVIKPKAVTDVKELDKKHHEGHKTDQNVDLALISMSQTKNQTNYENASSSSRTKHQTEPTTHSPKDKIEKVVQKNAEVDDAHQSKSKHQDNQKSTSELKHKSENTSKTLKSGNSYHNPNNKTERNSAKDPTELRKHSIEPKENTTKPAVVHYHHKPSDASYDFESSSLTRHGHTNQESEENKNRTVANNDHKPKTSKIRSTDEPTQVKSKENNHKIFKSKNRSFVEPSKVRIKAKSHKIPKQLKSKDSKINQDQVNKTNPDSNHHIQNKTIKKIQSSQKKSLELVKSTSLESKPRKEPTKNKSGSNHHKEPKHDPESLSNDKSPHKINLKSKSSIHTSHLVSSPTQNESAPSPQTKPEVHASSLDSQHNNSTKSAQVYSSHPLSTNTSESDLNDFQQEINHVISFLQKLVTYGPIVNPSAYTQAPKCHETHEKREKLDSKAGHDFVGPNTVENRLQPSPETDLNATKIPEVPEQQSVDTNIESSDYFGPAENNSTSDLEPSDSLSNANQSIVPDVNVPVATNEEKAEATVGSAVENSKVEPNLDQPVEEVSNTTATEITTQSQIEIQEHDTLNDNHQSKTDNQSESDSQYLQVNHFGPDNTPEPSGQTQSTTIDSNLYKESMHEADPSSDQLINPKFETILAPNPATSNTEGEDTQGQAEIIPMVVPYQPKENLSDVDEPLATEGPTLDTAKFEDSVVDSAILDSPHTNPVRSEDTSVEPETSEDPQTAEKDLKSEDSDTTTEAAALEITIEPQIHEEVVEPSTQDEPTPSTQSPAPAPTPGNPWLMHIFGKFSHLMNRP